ncbi:MAG: undecaprenyldiphospho-muramoylpentapeptide beta-N-acetylglucosaminyltransferase [Ruminococcus sp.]|jgi:UDP-N-acetylglucosamine--N-acetylmuramyl-(pentapeptide) pyrophosphoryl-undecaprenol N-acetylglucosamine transferase|nr:undecaprenyldiphospho-muramoylpentapeptide beta-N-acetylglucosaminyltransferase [Ruminococcus sp.]
MNKILLSGGGTAGHVNPALAIAEIIKKHNPGAEFLYVGTPDGMEKGIVTREGYEYAAVAVDGFSRKLTPKGIMRNIRSLTYLAKSGTVCKNIIKNFSPDIVIGTGGYVCGPVCMTAAKMGIPTLIHEQNAFPGVTTKLLSERVDEVMLAFPDAAKRLGENVKYSVTGLPTRDSFTERQMTRAEAKAKLGLDDSLTILSFGGSLGARCINNVALDVISFEEKLRKQSGIKINHIHGYGKNGREDFLTAFKDLMPDVNNKRLKISEYINDMTTNLIAADLVIARAGASTITELEALGRASILIPSPNVTENHQYYNAMVLGSRGAAVVYEEKELTPGKITAKIEELIKSPDKLNQMAKNAAAIFEKTTAEKIYSVIVNSTQK